MMSCATWSQLSIMLIAGCMLGSLMMAYLSGCKMLIVHGLRGVSVAVRSVLLVRTHPVIIPKMSQYNAVSFSHCKADQKKIFIYMHQISAHIVIGANYTC